MTRHFMQYHNTEKRGVDCTEVEPFRILTKKSVKGLPGNKVWLVAGKGRNPRGYYLYQVFRVEEVGPTETGGFKFFARGGDGTRFLPPLPIAQEPWFPEFLESVQRFSLGLRELPSEFLPRFQELAERRVDNQRSDQ